MTDLNPPVPPAGPPPAKGRSARRTAIIAVTALVVVAVLGGGAFAVWKVFFNGGPQPAEALPASTLAMVSLDLNPSAGQKVSAIKTMRKFPELKGRVGLKTDDDLRRFIYDKATDDGQRCPDLSYARDVEPWVGKRVALAAVDLGTATPAPVVALQVKDVKKAAAGLEKIRDCAGASGDGTDGEDSLEFATGDGYLIISDSRKHADQIVAKAKNASLAEDAGYQKWTAAAGDAGVVNFYVGKSAAHFALENFGDELDSLVPSGGDGEFSDLSSLAGPSAEHGSAGVAKSFLKGFKGLGGTVRFADGGMELSVAAGGVGKYAGSSAVGKQIGDLPKDTTLALGIGVPKDYARTMMDQMSSAMGATFEDGLREIETQTGLELPEDLQTLLGKSITLSLGGSAPRSLSELSGPTDLPIGVLINGDGDQITDVISKVEDHLGESLKDQGISVSTGKDRVAVGFAEDYTDKLLENGSLADTDNFTKAVPNAARASSIFYADFASQWVKTIVHEVSEEEDSETARKVKENLSPLEALGISSWSTGGVSHVLVKLTTD